MQLVSILVFYKIFQGIQGLLPAAAYPPRHYRLQIVWMLLSGELTGNTSSGIQVIGHSRVVGPSDPGTT